MIINDEFLENVKKIAEETEILEEIEISGVEISRIVEYCEKYDGRESGFVFEIKKDNSLEYLGVYKTVYEDVYAEKMYPCIDVIYRTNNNIELDCLQY